MSDLIDGGLGEGAGVALRSYPGPWKGELLLACGKCQRKLKGRKEHRAIAKLRKSLKEVAKEAGDGQGVKVLRVPCLKMCPKGGVTVCLPSQVATGECSIVRTREDVGVLHGQMVRERPVRERSEMEPS